MDLKVFVDNLKFNEKSDVQYIVLVYYYGKFQVENHYFIKKITILI
jgi:hypothetical protein